MESKAADILLGNDGPCTRFIIKWCGISFYLKIKLISTGRLIRISREISKIRDVDDKEEITMFQALMEHVSDAKHICRAIAIATGTPFVGIVTRAILKLSLADQNKLFDIVISQSDARVFFYTITSAKKLNLMKKKQEQ